MAFGEMMDDRKRYETVKSRLRAMGQGTAQQVHDAIEPSPYSVREVENTLDEMALANRTNLKSWQRISLEKTLSISCLTNLSLCYCR